MLHTTHINGAQRTRKQALTHIIEQFDAGLLGASLKGACLYELERPGQPPLHCGVGCLFNPAQIQDIKDRGQNYETIYSVAKSTNGVGVRNVETVTGLLLEDLLTLQREHDTAFQYTDERSPKMRATFRNFLVEQLKNS